MERDTLTSVVAGDLRTSAANPISIDAMLRAREAMERRELEWYEQRIQPSMSTANLNQWRREYLAEMPKNKYDYKKVVPELCKSCDLKELETIQMMIENAISNKIDEHNRRVANENI